MFWQLRVLVAGITALGRGARARLCSHSGRTLQLLTATTCVTPLRPAGGSGKGFAGADADMRIITWREGSRRLNIAIDSRCHA